MFWVWLKSSAASTSSKMYMGAGLYSNRARIKDNAISDRCPPLSSLRLCFQISPKAILTSSPSQASIPSGGSNLAFDPGSNVENIDPKFLLTFFHVRSSSTFFFTSKFSMTVSIFFLSFSTTLRLRRSSVYSPSAFSIIPMTFLLIFFACDNTR